MTPSAILLAAQHDGVRLAVTPAGTIKARGPTDALARWTPILTEHKAGLIAALKAAGQDNGTRTCETCGGPAVLGVGFFPVKGVAGRWYCGKCFPKTQGRA